jgi:hypothetical protein
MKQPHQNTEANKILDKLDNIPNRPIISFHDDTGSGKKTLFYREDVMNRRIFQAQQEARSEGEQAMSIQMGKYFKEKIAQARQEAVEGERERLIEGFVVIRRNLTGNKYCLNKEESNLLKFLDDCISMIKNQASLSQNKVSQGKHES